MPVHHLSIGDLSIHVIFDGGSPLDAAGIAQSFKLSDEEAGDLYARLPAGYAMSGNPLYVQSNGQHILVDVGIGGGYSPDNGKLLGELASLGVQPEQIELVIITHLHFDHMGGLRLTDETAAFPNAQVYIARDEWAHWVESGKAPAERVALIQSLAALYEGRVHLYDAGHVFAAGLSAYAMPGHTPGHHGIMFESNGKRALTIVDAVHAPFQFANPDLSPIYDVDPLLSAKTRRDLFNRAADAHLLLLTYHLPFPGIGYVVRKDDAFRWDEV